jgi:inorganic pyrophosphatase
MTYAGDRSEGDAAEGGLEVEVIVETPRSSRNKYEVDEHGHVRYDRRLPGAFAFPCDYGFIPGTVSSDGEPIDALVLMIEPTYPGVRVRARVIGLFWIMTGHGREPKIVCVPVTDPAYESIWELDQLPAHQLAEIAHFFDIYRDLDPGKEVRSDGTDGSAAAASVLAACRAAGGQQAGGDR